MQCVIQTDDFASAAKHAGLSEADVFAIEALVAADPTIGALIPGTGGARKFRVPAKGRGKRSGARVVSYYAADDVPVFLLDVYVKGDRIDLSQKERNELKLILGSLAESYRASVKRKVVQLSETGT
ncbi:MAG: type II toxin-antitoxin system RelE/ParE family toxin [Xanthobacteraceae bacterium]